jgi:predicted PurR-regulated permease PerM
MAPPASDPGRTPSPGPGAQDHDERPLAARLHLWQVQAVRDVLWVAATLGLLWLGYALRAVTVPLLVALLLAYLFEPIIQWLCQHPKLRLTRVRAVTLLLLGVGGLVAAVLILTVPLMVSQTARLLRDVRDGTMHTRAARLEPLLPEAVRPEYRDLIDLLPPPATPAADEIGAALSPADALDAAAAPTALSEDRVRAIIADELERRAPATPGGAPPQRGWVDVAREGAAAVAGVIAASVQIGLLAFLIPFYFFFFSLSFPEFLRFGRTLLPLRNRPRALELLGKMDRVVSGFVRGRIVICLLMGIMLALGWWICGVPYAIVLGMLIGVFSIVPYLGGIGVPLAVGLLFFDQIGIPSEQRSILLGWWGIVLWPTLVFAIVQVVETYMLTPMIAGKATNLDPVTIIVAVLAGGSVLGVYGMLLAIPSAACLKILTTDVLMPKVRAWVRGEAEDPLPIGRS